MCLALTPVSLGAYLPWGSAPPEPAKLWHAVQLVRKISPPRTMLSLLALATSYSDFGGTSGPGPRDATYAPSWLISSGV